MATSQLDTTRQDAQPSSPKRALASHDDAAAPSTSKPRFMSSSSFRRSSGSFTGGGDMLARFTSSSSSRSQPDAQDGAQPAQRRPSIGQRLSSRASRKSMDAATGANLAELSKPNGKFKSGIKWHSQQPVPEPFMEISDSTAAQRELASALDANAALASGSTAAAKAHAQGRGFGQPIFPRSSSISANTITTSPSASSSAKDNSQLPTVSQTISALGSSGIHPDMLGTARSSAMQTEPAPAIVAAPVSSKADTSSAAPLEAESDTRSGDGATPCMTPPTKSREASYSEQGTSDNHMLARAAQLVLEAARQQARVETRKKGKSAPASPKRSTFNLSPITTSTTTAATTETNQDDSAIQQTTEGVDSELSRTPSQRARSKSDAGGDSKVKRRKSFLRSMSSKARRERSGPSDTPGAAGSETPTPSTNSPTTGSATTSGTVTPGGRRRRYADTRDLDLLARELAAEAIAEQIPQPPFARASRSGSSSPHRIKTGAAGFNDPRRRSFPSILEDSPLQDDSLVPISSSTNSLKPMTPLHSSRSNGRARAAEGKGMAGIGSSGLAPATLSDPTKGLVPKEMFIGLGGSSYPSLPPPSSRANGSTIDGTDPFGIPLTQESSPFDATMAYANKTNVYHTPNQEAVSRSRSNASIASASPPTSNNKRRPVLTMTMNDPEAELQGLTKPPKESSSKRLTPFGSRASSRAPSPSPSFTNLKKVAAAQQPADELNPPARDGDEAAREIMPTVDSKAVTAGSTAADADVRPEEASAPVESRRNSMAPSERSIRTGLAPVKSSRMTRLSVIFRSNKSRDQVDTMPSLQAPSPLNNASLSASPEMSAYATPAGEMASLAMSPRSAAVSADSDADISPVAFRTLELPSTQDTPRSSKPSSANASRRSSMALDNVERTTAKKRPVRAFLRRLSSFSSKKKEGKEEKPNFPDAGTMPVVDMRKIKQLSEDRDVKAGGLDASMDSKATSGVEAVPATGAAQATPVDVEENAKMEKGLVPALQGLDLSNASPVPVNEEMAKNGFGTRCAHKLGVGGSAGKDIEAVDKNGVEPERTNDAEESAKEGDAMAASEDVWDRSRPGQIVRSDSQTPSSEDSFFLESRPSLASRPGSGALMKHGSESAISEELHTPDPSTAYLPATKTEDAMLEDATLSSTLSSRVSSVTGAAAKVVAAAAGEGKSPVMTALPNEPVPNGVSL
ncbi:uncharacterized protein SPSC_04640 [Sporisorium scitamineum]|uniref:Uncharacterized protein n=1 Tax=Sporisorium scitamineum TaxID=49012 RepID=A0A0F7SA42_9BASI|nr:uncharacterized protein SPSC_04640 [Sporisorium scitamineum]CDW99136.1 hypothetical protein [Sporisorium scitamineum]